MGSKEKVLDFLVTVTCILVLSQLDIRAEGADINGKRKSRKYTENDKRVTISCITRLHTVTG